MESYEGARKISAEFFRLDYASDMMRTMILYGLTNLGGNMFEALTRNEKAQLAQKIDRAKREYRYEDTSEIFWELSDIYLDLILGK